MAQCKVLFLSANPATTSHLSLDREVREIEEQIRKSEFRDSLQLITKWAVRPDDLLQSLNEHQPDIVHFSGHGSETSQLMLQDQDSGVHPVSKESLQRLFQVFKDNIRVVVLNACFSRDQAEAITETIDCAVGMSRAIPDQVAITFAASFYRAIGFGKSIQQAFEQGQLAIQLENESGSSTKSDVRAINTGKDRSPVTDEMIPQLLIRSQVDPNQLMLIDATKTKARQQPTMHVDRSISIGGDATGNVITTGDSNEIRNVNVSFETPELGKADLIRELEKISSFFNQLSLPSQNKIDRALADAAKALNSEHPDRDEIGAAINRGVMAAKKSNRDFSADVDIHSSVAKIVAWLGPDWHHILDAFGIELQ